MSLAMPRGVGETCPACDGSAMEPLLAVERAPVSCAQLFPTLEAAVVAGQCRVEIVLCPSCGHIWNAAHQEGRTSLYNEDYYSSFTCSIQARQYQEALARQLDNLIGLDDKTVVEIGCGDGFFLGSLSDLGATAIGFEPSSTFEAASQQPRVAVFNDSFQFEGEGRVNHSVDLVVMRHVLEHVTSPEEILASLRGKSFCGPVPKYLLLEVPNALQLLLDNLYFDFYNDHVHYFSHTSLGRLLDSAGWKPLASLGASDEFIRLVCVNSAYAPDHATPIVDGQALVEPESVTLAARDFRENFGRWKQDLTGIIAAQREAGRSIAVWGAGARGIALLCGLGLDADSLAYVVDSDSNKHGKYLPVVNLSVKPVDQLQQEPVDCVLVTSYTYFDEILNQLDWFRASRGKVIKVYPTPELV